MTNNNTITNSSGNVFADLELENTDELLAKSKLAQEIRAIIKKRDWTQVKAAEVLHTDQPQVSRLNTGKGIDGMSFELLFNWLARLDQTVTLKVEPAIEGEESHSLLVVAV